MSNAGVAAVVVSENAHLTRPFTVYEESPSMAPTTPVKSRKYPNNLSRVPATIRGPMAHRRGTSKQYESLEDLLTAAGYKETRIFTPESERITDGSAGKQPRSKMSRDQSGMSEDAPSEPRSASGAIGEFVTSMLSGWMPGASISLGRAKGAQIARQEARDTVDDDQDESPPSPLARKSALPGQASRDALPPRAPQAHHSRPVLPLDFILNPSKPIRNDNQQSSTLSVRNMPPLHRPPQNRLYHAASSPHLSRTRTSNHQIGGRSELRGRQSQSTLTQRAVSTLQRSHTSPQQRPPLEPRLRSRPKSKHAALSPILHASSGPLVPVLRTEDVVCRSTPGSRSASVEGGRSRRRSDSPPPLPFFLTPTFGDENSPMWTQSADRVRHLGIHTNSSSTSDSEDLHDGDDDQNPDDVDPNLERIIFSRALHHRDTSPPSSSTTTTTSSSQNNHSGLEPPATARRQRSIQSLRAHLVPRPTSVASSGKQRINYSRNPIITLATPRTAEARLPGRAVWLDGPEWDGQAVKSKKSRRGKDDGKRGLIPWFGGESAFIEQGSPRRPAATDSEWDGWE